MTWEISFPWASVSWFVKGKYIPGKVVMSCRQFNIAQEYGTVYRPLVIHHFIHSRINYWVVTICQTILWNERRAYFYEQNNHISVDFLCPFLFLLLTLLIHIFFWSYLSDKRHLQTLQNFKCISPLPILWSLVELVCTSIMVFVTWFQFIICSYY